MKMQYFKYKIASPQTTTYADTPKDAIEEAEKVARDNAGQDVKLYKLVGVYSVEKVNPPVSVRQEEEI